MSLLGFQVRTEDDDLLEVEPVEPPAEVPAPSPAPLVLLKGDRMTQRDGMLAAFAHAVRLARRRSIELAEREGGMASGLLGGQPPSVKAQHEYAKARKWVPPGHDGGVLEGMGVAYHWLIGRPGVAAGNALSALSARPFRWCGTAIGVLISANVALYATGHHLAALLTDAAAVLLLCAWAGAGYLLMRISDANPPARDNETDET